MYFTIAFMMTTMLPIPFIARATAKNGATYDVIARGTLIGAVGALVVLMFASFGGEPISESLEALAVDSATMMASNSSVMDALQMSDLSSAERISQLTIMYQTYFRTVPAMFFIWAAIASYIEYTIISKVFIRSGLKIRHKEPIREFNLGSSGLMLWFALYLVSYLISSGTESMYADIFINVGLLFRLVFALQGVAVFFFMFDMKKLPKILPVIVTVLGFTQNIGITIFFIVGLIESSIGIRKRMTNG